MEKVFSIVRKMFDRKPTDDMKYVDLNTAILVYIHVCHTSSCSSSWTRLFDVVAIRQKSIFEVCGTILPDSWEVDQRADVDDRSVYDQLGPAVCGENRLCRVVELFELWIPKPTSFPTRCFAWEASVQNQFKLGKTKLYGIRKLAFSKNWIELMENRWNSSEQISRIHTMSMFNDIVWWEKGMNTIV